MKKTLAVGVALGLFSIMATSDSALAEIINGGFETGDLSSWTTSGQVSVTSAGLDARTNNNLSTVGVDTRSAKVGDQDAFGYVGSQYSSISQTWAKESTFEHLYFAWAAVGLVPTNTPHSVSETPWFQVTVQDMTTSTTLLDEAFYTGNIGSITPGWLQGATQSAPLGQNSAGTWYYRPWETFDLNVTSIADGDLLRVTLTTRDCSLSGHASYAYLDGFGSVRPPIDPVPEPATMLLLGTGLAGLVGARRRKKA